MYLLLLVIIKHYSKNLEIGNRNFHSKLPIIVFQINSVSLIESAVLRETSNKLFSYLVAIISVMEPRMTTNILLTKSVVVL